MNLLLIERHELESGSRVTLRDRRADHLRKVLRVEPGRRLRIGVINGFKGHGTVISVDPGQVVMDLEVEEGEAPCPTVDLIVGMPRPQVLHRVLQTAATMEVARLDLVNAWRVEKSFFQSPSATPEKMHRQLLLGAEQGRKTRLPDVTCRKLLVPFVRGLEDTAPTLRLIADPGASRTLEEVVEEVVEPSLREVERFVVAIGPEGGWIDRELQTFQEEGFVPVDLGPWILRVENAVTAALAQLELVRRSRPKAQA